MNRERAETYLRVLAEAELRRATSQSWGDAQRVGDAARVQRVAQVLAFAGALDDEVDEISRILRPDIYTSIWIHSHIKIG